MTAATVVTPTTVPVSTPANQPPRWRPRPWNDSADLSFVVLLLAAVVLVAAHATPNARLPIVLVAMLVSPGYAVVRLIGLSLDAESLAMTVATSMATTALLSAAEAETHWWRPRATELAVAVIAVLILAAVRRVRPARPSTVSNSLSGPDAVPARSRSGSTARPDVWSMRLVVPLTGLVAIALLLWIAAMINLSISNMGPWGLLPRLSGYWYAGLGLVAIGALLSQRLVGISHRLLSLAFLGLLLLYLYCTAPAVEGTPRYVWVYKHIGVVRYVMAHHGVHNLDIYQRWPAFFSTAAFFGSLSGHSDPVSWAGWGEPFFTVLDLIMFFPLAKRFTRNSQGAWVACYFFLAANWVGQQYFSPQAFAFALTLACLLLATALLDGRIPLLPHRLLGSRWGVPAQAALHVRASAMNATAVRLRRRGLLPMLVLFDAAVVVSHQLTPYILLIDFILLGVAGLLRPRWLVIIFGLLTVAFLLPNLTFVQSNFGLFSAIDPFRNATATLGGATGNPVSTLRYNRYFAAALSGLIWGIGLLGLLIAGRRAADKRGVLVLGLLFIAPFLTLFVQSYGGEARLRVLLFSLPAASILAGLLWQRSRTGGGFVRRVAMSLVVLPIPLALFIPNFFDREDVYYIPPAEVTAADWLYANAAHQQVLMFADTNFPGLLGGDYTDFIGAPGSEAEFSADLDGTSVVEAAELARQTINAGVIAAAMRQYTPNGYLVFATSEAVYARDYGTYGGLPGYQALERDIARSSTFEVVYRNSTTTIYRMR